MRNKIDTSDLPDEELVGDEVQQKTKKRTEKLEQRKKLKKKDTIERFSGVIFVSLIFLIGLLLWVGGAVGGGTHEIPASSSRVIME